MQQINLDAVRSYFALPGNSVRASTGVNGNAFYYAGRCVAVDIEKVTIEADSGETITIPLGRLLSLVEV